jgi:hypothetical protein
MTSKSSNLRTRRRVWTIPILFLAIVIPAGSVSAVVTTDARQFGWVTESGGQHRVCGYAETFGTTTLSVLGTGISWYKGWGTGSITCKGTTDWVYGDTVATGWLGASGTVYKGGVLCNYSGVTYNSSATSAWAGPSGQCANPSGTQVFYSRDCHQWWALDSNAYAGACHNTPSISV